MSEAQTDSYRRLLARRLTGEPIAYILGEREFYGRPFRVDSGVLIPRPETEHLIEAVLELSLPSNPRILDVGTGSASIAATLALELPTSTIVATDLSAAALRTAQINIEAHDLGGRVELVQTDLVSGLDLSTFDLVVSNPPYIDPQVAPTLSIEVTEFEPHEALFAPDSGLGTIDRLVSDLAGLRAKTPVVLEIGYDQGEAVRQLVEEYDFAVEELRADLAGLDRIAVLRRR